MTIDLNANAHVCETTVGSFSLHPSFFFVFLMGGELLLLPILVLTFSLEDLFLWVHRMAFFLFHFHFISLFHGFLRQFFSLRPLVFDVSRRVYFSLLFSWRFSMASMMSFKFPLTVWYAWYEFHSEWNAIFLFFFSPINISFLLDPV